MNIKGILGVAVMCMTLLVGSASAADLGSREEAQALVEKASALYKQDPKKALETFQDKAGGFIDRDLYIFVFDKAGTFLANGAKPAMVGKGALDMTDVNGFAMVKAFLEVKDKGWVDYKWTSPIDNKPHDKSSYIVRVGDEIIGCGYYKN